jgi:hypothetical protein
MLGRVLIFCLLPFSAGAAPTLDLTVVGNAQTVFFWDTDRCATWDVPDAPARAWRTADGQVAVISGSEATRRSRGPTLDALTRECHVIHAGAENDDPSAWDDRTWIASVHTEDGVNVVALGHVEYHGHLRPATCPSGTYSKCWYNSVVELRSSDGGRNFTRVGGAGDLVAASSDPYRGEAEHRLGFFNPSNILTYDGHLYAFVFAEASGAQRRGPCLIRRPLSGGADDWKAWNGFGFGTRLGDPDRGRAALAEDRTCQPLSGLHSTVSSVVRDEARKLFIAVTPMRNRAGDVGIFWASSPDLLHWTQPRLLLRVPLLWHRDCAAPAAYAYPSLIDPDSPSQTFDTTDDRLWLYLSRISLNADCTAAPERDLIRLAVQVRALAGPP